MPANASSNSTAEHGDPPRWVSAHLYYHDPLDELLRRAVHPLVGELAAGGLIDGFFFVRYWQGGPHVRLRARLPGQAEAQPVQRLIEERIGRFFVHHPSRALVPAESYQRSADRLAQHEFRPVSGDASQDS
ncbi:MAG: thiopeptide-type bacteriocin biosynthesis protein [Mycobacterium sp.]